MALAPEHRFLLHRSTPTKENHEAGFPAASMRIMARSRTLRSVPAPTRGTKSQGEPSGSNASNTGVSTMTWQTPAATEFRFGFEITMYIANR